MGQAVKEERFRFPTLCELFHDLIRAFKHDCTKD
jgi:hypothetical protein